MNKTTLAVLIFAGLTMFSLGSCVAVNCQNYSDEIKGNEGIEIIKDNTFEKGFALTPLDSRIVQQGGGFEKTYVGTLDFGVDGSAPVWPNPLRPRAFGGLGAEGMKRKF